MLVRHILPAPGSNEINLQLVFKELQQLPFKKLGKEVGKNAINPISKDEHVMDNKNIICKLTVD